MDKKPGLMIAVLDGLKKKGKMDSPSDEMKEGEYPDEASEREHLEQISKELIDAVHSKDVSAVADLLEEAFMCLDAQPHEEGPHLGEEDE